MYPPGVLGFTALWEEQGMEVGASLVPLKGGWASVGGVLRFAGVDSILFKNLEMLRGSTFQGRK